MSVGPISANLPMPSRPRVDPYGGVSVGGATTGMPAAGSEPAVAFSDMLSDAISSVAQQLRSAESVSIAGLRGAAPTHEVVEQVMRAEQSLQASIAVRDKIVAAYLEISRMQI